MKIFFVQFFCVFLPPLFNIFSFCQVQVDIIKDPQFWEMYFSTFDTGLRAVIYILLFSPKVVSNSLWPLLGYSLPDCSIHGISQARILEWVAISFCRGASWPRDGTCASCIGRQILYHWATSEVTVIFLSLALHRTNTINGILELKKYNMIWNNIICFI